MRESIQRPEVIWKVRGVHIACAAQSEVRAQHTLGTASGERQKRRMSKHQTSDGIIQVYVGKNS